MTLYMTLYIHVNTVTVYSSNRYIVAKTGTPKAAKLLLEAIHYLRMCGGPSQRARHSDFNQWSCHVWFVDVQDAETNEIP